MNDEKNPDAPPENTAPHQRDKKSDKPSKPNQGAPPVGEQEEVNEPHPEND